MAKTKLMNTILSKKRGFSVLFATLIGSLVLAIGLAILSITIKQIKLSAAGRESQHAFYAADTGVECALYLDGNGGNTNCEGSIFPEEAGQGICEVSTFQYYQCLNKNLNRDDDISTTGETASLSVVETGADYVTTKISIGDGDSSENNICFDVYVTKKVVGDSLETEIESRGYSTCNASSANRFERAIRVRY